MLKTWVKHRRLRRAHRAETWSGCLAELLELRRMLASPGTIDLIPFAPAGWSDKIVVSTASGTSTDGAVLTSADKLYIDAAVGNAGDTATAVEYANRLLVDGGPADTWTPPAAQALGVFLSNLDAGVGPLTARAPT